MDERTAKIGGAIYTGYSYRLILGKGAAREGQCTSESAQKLQIDGRECIFLKSHVSGHGRLLVSFLSRRAFRRASGQTPLSRLEDPRSLRHGLNVS